MKSLKGCIVPAIALVALSMPARADIAPPDVYACLGAKVGQTCTADAGVKNGSCMESTCTHLAWGLDGASPLDSGPTSPGQVTVTATCLRCLANTATTTVTTTSTTTFTLSGTGTATSTIPTSTLSSTATSTASEPKHGGRGACVLGSHFDAKQIAPWLLAGAFSLLFLSVRRRRR